MLKGPLRRLLMVNFAANVPVGVFLVTWQLDATDRGGLPAESLGPIFSGLMLAMALGNIAAGALLPGSRRGEWG